MVLSPSQGSPAAGSAADEVTVDRVFGGAVVVHQQRRGYRFTSDATWLVAASLASARGRVVDLGAGCGVIGLALAQRPPVTGLVLVELQPTLAALARSSIEAKQLHCPAAVVEADLRGIGRRDVGGAAQLVVANPPFFAATEARAAARSERDRARRALAGDVFDFAAAAARLIDERGCFALVYPARQLQSALAACAAAHLRVHTLRFVHPRPDAPARLALILARRVGAPVLEVLTPWHEQTASGAESTTARRLRQRRFLIPA